MIRKFICMMALAAISLSPYAQERLEGQKGSVVGIKTNLPYWGGVGNVQRRCRVPPGTALEP